MRANAASGPFRRVPPCEAATASLAMPLEAVTALPSRPSDAQWRWRSGPSRLVKLGVDRPSSLRGHPGHAFEFLLRRGEKPLGGAEVLDQCAPARRPDSWKRVENRLASPRVAPLTMEADREPVRLVPHALQELQPRRVARQQDRLRPPRDEDLFDPFRHRKHGHPPPA